MKWQSARIPLFALAGEGFFSRFSFSMMGFAFPLYARHLGLSLSEVGILISLNVAVAMALKPAMGAVADRFGWRRSAIAGVGLRSLVPLLLAVSWLPWHLYGARAFHGICEALRDPSVKTLLAVHGGKNAVASAFAYYATSRSVGAALGHSASGILLTLTASNFSLVFIVSCVCALLSLYGIARFLPKRDDDPDGVAGKGAEASTVVDPQEAEMTGKAGAARPKLLAVTGLGFFSSTAAQMLHGLFPVLATEYAGLSAAETGIIYAVSACVLIFSGPLFGWLSDNVSRELVLLVRGGANILSSGVYLAAPTFPGIAAARCVDDLGKAAFRPAWGAMMGMASSLDGKRRARTIGVASVGENAGDIAGPILAGFLWNTWGIAAVMGVRIVLAATTEVYALALGRKLSTDENQHYRVAGEEFVGPIPDKLLSQNRRQENCKRA